MERYLTGLLWNVQVRGRLGLPMITQRFGDSWNHDISHEVGNIVSLEGDQVSYGSRVFPVTSVLIIRWVVMGLSFTFSLVFVPMTLPK